ncbi:MAG: diaminopimelate epimerase [Nitrospinota bacterium]|nr:diaminopimelate epimerase [Nitrospinota bacterium]
MVENIKFMKLSGSGNDFIFVENFDNEFKEESMADFVKSVCRRGLSVGADGLMFIESSEKADFKWRFFNADGSEGEMCGNGGRCAIRFAKETGLIKKKGSFETMAGVLDASIDGNRVKVKMTKPHSFTQSTKIILRDEEVLLDSINTGVPHAILYTKNLDSVDVLNDGREIRRHSIYQPDGTNVNFVKVLDSNNITIRTYERGVEDETLACGTGAVASSLLAAARNLVESPVNVQVKSGESLMIHFEGNPEDTSDVYMEGDTRLVYTGEMQTDALA